MYESIGHPLPKNRFFCRLQKWDWKRHEKRAFPHSPVSTLFDSHLASGTGILNAIFGFHRLRPDGLDENWRKRVN